MIKETAAPPAQRFNKISAIHHDLLHAKSETLENFGISIGKELITADAKIMTAAPLEYRSRGQPAKVCVDMSKGQWNLRGPGGDMEFVEGAKISSYMCVIFEHDVQERNAITFLDFLERMARGRAMDLGRRIGIIDATRNVRSGEDVVRFLDAQVNAYSTFSSPWCHMRLSQLNLHVGATRQVKGLPANQRPQLVICVMGDKELVNGRELYPAIKRWSHTISDIPTQYAFGSARALNTRPATSHLGFDPPRGRCVQKSKAVVPGKTHTNPQYHAGLLLKINLKLGGVNVHSPEGLGGLRPIRDKPTIFFGVDVNHAPPNSSKPSYYALVASMDKECAKYVTATPIYTTGDHSLHTAHDHSLHTARDHTSSPVSLMMARGRYHTIPGVQTDNNGYAATRKEQLSDLKVNVRKCLAMFKERNRVAPERIVFFRDGVANNQFHNECAFEVGEIRQACKEEGEAYLPELIYIVVQQRTRARFATERNEQVKCGTVVDTMITSMVPVRTAAHSQPLVVPSGCCAHLCCLRTCMRHRRARSTWATSTWSPSTASRARAAPPTTTSSRTTAR